MLAGWQDLFGRQESSHLLGGHKIVCVATCGLCPALWTSGASDNRLPGLTQGGDRLQRGRGGSQHAKVRWGPGHWDWGAELFQKRQLKVDDWTPVWEEGSGTSYWVWKSGRLAEAAGMREEDSWHHRQN